VISMPAPSRRRSLFPYFKSIFMPLPLFATMAITRRHGRARLMRRCYRPACRYYG
jgi:hypothetical protein